jgi:hypothetical protein
MSHSNYVFNKIHFHEPGYPKLSLELATSYYIFDEYIYSK